MLHVSFPAPELLSLEQQNLEILEWDNGLWNRLNENDAAEAVNSMAGPARHRLHEPEAVEHRPCDQRAVPTVRRRTPSPRF